MAKGTNALGDDAYRTGVSMFLTDAVHTDHCRTKLLSLTELSPFFIKTQVVFEKSSSEIAAGFALP